MTKKLADTLKETSDSVSREAAAKNKESARLERDRIHREGRIIADSIIETLPALLKKEAKRGALNLKVDLGSDLRAWTKQESYAAFLIDLWARDEGLRTSHYHSDMDDWPATDALWISWT